MRLRIGNALTKVVEATNVELDWLRTYLTFTDVKKMFMEKKWGGSGKTCLLDRRGPSFPSGLVPMVVRAAAEEYEGTDGGTFDRSLETRIDPDPELLSEVNEEFRVVIEDERERPCDWDWDADLEWLYDYQYEPVWIFGQTSPRGILKIPTGGGKTEVAVGLIKALPCNWLFIVDSKDLVNQAAARWKKRTGLGCGILSDGVWEPDPENRITFATFQTLARHEDSVEIIRKRLKKVKANQEALAKGKKVKKIKPPTQKEIDDAPNLKRRAQKYLATVEGLLVDEAHTLAADTFAKLVLRMSRAYFRVGLSATPLDRSDRRSVVTVGALGPIVYEVPTQLLIKKKRLARPHIYVAEHFEECESSLWQTSYKKILVESEDYHSLCLDLVKAAAKPSLVFVEREAHGKTLCKYINQSGITAEFVWGKKNSAQREQAIKNLQKGYIDVIVTSRIFQKGIDIPDLRSVVNCAGMRSVIAALQRLGRGMRTDQGRKMEFELWDVKINGDRFMHGHSLERIRAYKREGHEVELVKRKDILQHIKAKD